MKLLLIILLCLNLGATDLISKLFKKEEQKKYGIHKLTNSERLNLSMLLEVLLKSNSLSDSALKYLKNNDWHEIEVIGIQTIKNKEYLIVQGSIYKYTLESQNYSTLSNGKYLGKLGYTSSEIINNDGEILEFWTKSTN